MLGNLIVALLVILAVFMRVSVIVIMLQILRGLNEKVKAGTTLIQALLQHHLSGPWTEGLRASKQSDARMPEGRTPVGGDPKGPGGIQEGILHGAQWKIHTFKSRLLLLVA